MKKIKQDKTKIEQAGKNLFDFAVDREDTKILMENLHKEADIKRTTVEYELQVLRIITIGWSISYFLENSVYKNKLVEIYWMAVYEFSQSISSVSGLMIGQDFNYYQILKNRLDKYLDAMHNNSDASEPVITIGPEFAKICGNANDIFTIMAGSKMFTATLNGVKKYLEVSLEISL